MAREMVMQARRPSGTLATKMPMPKMMHWRALYLTTSSARTKKTTPSEMAMTVMISTKRSSSIRRGERWFPPVAARSAICPITVFAPMLITMPRPRPSLQSVPKKAIFLVSKGYSGCVHSGERSNGSTSPVSGELSTFISIEEIILKSAGTFSPLITYTISPLTNFSAGSCVNLPSLRHLVTEGSIFLNPSMRASDCACWLKVMTPVMRMTMMSTKAR